MGVRYWRGAWWIDYRFNGRRYRKKVGPNKTLADQALSKIKVEIAENKFLDVKREKCIKFEDFADEYFEKYCKLNHKGYHKASGSSIKILKRYFSGKYLHEINPQAIEKFKRERLKEVCPTTVNRALSYLKALFNKAIAWDKFGGENPVKKVKFFPENNQRTRFLEKEEIVRLIANCKGRIQAIVIVALNTGMRKAEILNLKWQDIDFNRGIIYVMRTKNGEMKELPMNDMVKTTLLKVNKTPTSPYVFPNKEGKPLSNIRKSFTNALTESGITDFRFHDCRHSFASQPRKICDNDIKG